MPNMLFRSNDPIQITYKIQNAYRDRNRLYEEGDTLRTQHSEASLLYRSAQGNVNELNVIIGAANTKLIKIKEDLAYYEERVSIGTASDSDNEEYEKLLAEYMVILGIIHKREQERKVARRDLIHQKQIMDSVHAQIEHNMSERIDISRVLTTLEVERDQAIIDKQGDEDGY